MCIVGRVGAGKSALLSSMINEVKKVSGHVKFGGRLSYGQSFGATIMLIISTATCLGPVGIYPR